MLKKNDTSLFELGEGYNIFPDRCATSSVDATSIVGHVLFSQPKKCGKIDAKFAKTISKKIGSKNLSPVFAPDSIPYKYGEDGYKTVGDVVRDDWQIKDGALPTGAFIVDTKPSHNLIINTSAGIADHSILKSYVDMFARSRNNNNIVIYDRRGEALHFYGKELEKYGYDIRIIDTIGARRDDGTRVFGTDKTCITYNPLALAVKYVIRARNDTRSDWWTKVAIVVNDAVADLMCRYPEGGDPFHPTAAYYLVLGLIYALIWNALEDLANEPTVNNYANPLTDSKCVEIFERVNLANVYDILVKIREDDFNSLNELGIKATDEDDICSLFENTISRIYERTYIDEKGDEYDFNFSIRQLLKHMWDIVRVSLGSNDIFFAINELAPIAEMRFTLTGIRGSNVFDTEEFVADNGAKKQIIFFVYGGYQTNYSRYFRTFIHQVLNKVYASVATPREPIKVKGTRFVIDDLSMIIDAQQEGHWDNALDPLLAIGHQYNQLFTVAASSIDMFRSVFGLTKDEDFEEFEKTVHIVFIKSADDTLIEYFLAREKKCHTVIPERFGYNDLAFMDRGCRVILCPDGTAVWCKNLFPYTTRFNTVISLTVL